nr:hypothetical protein [Tanacetum cinerariifolium]
MVEGKVDVVVDWLEYDGVDDEWVLHKLSWRIGYKSKRIRIFFTIDTNSISMLFMLTKERVHDYQLGLESYQLNVNLIAPKLTFPGIKEKKSYTINSLPFIGLIYENSKKEKRIMDIDEIPKFCDATLKRVLKEERVHDYQLGLESYQLNVNLIAPKLTFPGIKEKKSYTINSLPFIGLIYENSKKEKRIMDIDEIPKFCDATLKRVLKEVKKINLDVKHGYADLTLSKDDA